MAERQRGPLDDSKGSLEQQLCGRQTPPVEPGMQTGGSPGYSQQGHSSLKCWVSVSCRVVVLELHGEVIPLGS